MPDDLDGHSGTQRARLPTVKDAYDPDNTFTSTTTSRQRALKRNDTDDFGCGSQSQHVRPWLHRNNRLE
jgi:hypothetical protein